MTVTIYTTPNCVQCEQTKRFFKKHDIEFVSVNLHEDQEAYEKVKGMGYQSAPVVTTATDSWSGFRLDKLKGLVK